MKQFAFFVLLVGLIASAARAETHVVFVTIDTLRADRLEPYGYTKGKTPTITSLSKEGITFENAIVQTPITLPSHASILTGAYPFYHRVQDVVGRLQGVPTITEWFKKKGYQTAAFVGSSVLNSHWGLNAGFDVYDDRFPTQGLRQVDFDRLERRAEEVIARASDWLEKNARPGGKPVFIWIHLYDPHDPYTPPEPFATEFKERPYDGEIAYVDSALAKLFDTLRRLNAYDQSLIVFTADHGESLGEHKESYHGYFVYESSLRVPLIFKLPKQQARVRAGTRVANQVRSVDIAPTMIHLLGEQPPGTMQGESLLAVMAGNRPNLHLPAYAESHYPRIHFGWSPLFSYSTLDYKYIDAPVPELYDLKKDAAELNNVYESNKALAHRMKEELRGLQQRFAVPAGTQKASEEMDPETMERLKSLGYVAFSSGSAGAGGKLLPDPKEKIETYNQLNRAILLSRQGRIRLAIGILDKVALQEPEMPVVHFLLGMEYFTLRQYLKAAEEFAQTIRYNPESNVARFNLARAQSQAGLSEKAQGTLTELLGQEPEHFAARHLLATILAKKGRLQEAIAEELKALQVRPSYVDAHNNLGSYYFSLGEVDNAIQSYRKALEYAPENLMARANLSLAYLKQGRYDQALEQARIAAEQEPKYSLAHYYLGQAYLGKGMKQEATAAFRKAKEIDPKLEIPTL